MSGDRPVRPRPSGARATAVCTPRELEYSETFIRAHVEQLPGPVVTIAGSAQYYTHAGAQIFPLPLRAVLHARHKLSPGMAAFTDALGHRCLARFLRARGVRVVLAEYGETGAAMLPVCALAGIPMVVHFHGVDAYRRDLVSHHAGYRDLFAGAKGIIAVSRDMERQLLSLGAPRERLFYSPYGVDLAVFNKTAPEANPPRFVAVGRFVDKKAPHLTLLAFERVVKAVPDAQLTMVGEGELLDACRELAIALAIDSRVEFLGRQSPDEVARIMGTARAFVQHSVVAPSGDSEGTPLSVLEAGASGIPVIATRHAGIQEAVVHGETGLLVEEFDVAGMAARMIEVATDPGLAGRLGAGARDHISRHYSVETSIARLAGILDAAAAQPA